MANETTLSLIIKAIDRATGPVRAIAKTISHLTAPVQKLGRHLKEFAEVSGLARLGEAFKGVGESVHKVGEKAFELGKELAVMALEAGFVLFELVHHFVEVGDQLKKNAERVGLTVNEYAELEFAAKKAGVSHEEFTVALDAFNKGLGQAKAGSGKLFGFLKEVSPTLLHQATSAKTNAAALDLMWKAMDKLKDPSKRAAFAAAAFGKSGVKMGAVVRDGLGAFEDQRKKFRELGGDQTEFAENSEKLADSIIDVQAAFGGLGAAIAGELFPALVDLANVVKDFLVQNRDGLREWARETGKAIGEWVRGGGIQRLIAGFKDLLATVQPIVDRLGGWPKVLLGIAAVIMAGPLLGALASMAASFVTLGLALLGTPVGWFLAAVAAIAAIAFVVVKNWGAVSGFFKEFFPGFSSDVTAAADGLKVLVGWTGRLIDYLKEQKQLRENMAGIRAGDHPGAKGSGVGWVAGIEQSIDDSTFGKWANRTFGPGPAIPGTEAARQSLAAGGSPTKIQVDFNGAPKGTRVETDPGDGHEVDTSVGYTMVGG